MIEIEVNGEFLKLEKNASIRFEKNYTTLFQDLYQGDYSFPFTLNAEANYKILGYANIPEASNKTTSFDCYIYLFGLPFKRAKLIITKASKYKFQVNLVAGIKTLKTSGKNLRDLDFGAPFYLGKLSNEIAAKATTISQDMDYTHLGFTFVPHSNPDFYGDSNPDFKGVLNMVNPNDGTIYYNTLATGNKYSLVPWFFLHYILQKICDAEGLTPTGTFWNNAEMKTLLVYNNKSLDSLNEIGATKVGLSNYFNVYASDFADMFTLVKIPIIKGVANTFDEPMAFNNTQHEYEITAPGNYTLTFNGYAYYDYQISIGFAVNGVYIGGVDNDPGSYSGSFPNTFSVSYTATIGDVGKKITFVVKANWFLPAVSYPLLQMYATSTVDIKQSNVDNVNFYSQYVFPAKHMKDMSVEEFLLSVKQLGLDFTFDYVNNIFKMDFITDKINTSTTKDWTNKAVTEYEIDLDNYNKGYTVGYNFGETDLLNTDNFKAITASNTIEEYMTFANLPAISETGKTAFVKNLNQYFIASYDVAASPHYFWKKYTDHYYTTKYAGGETQVKLGFAPMLMGMAKNLAPVTNATLETALMPASKCVGSSDMFSVGDNDYELRFCFLRGQNSIGGSPNNKGGNYMYASSTRYGLNGHIVGNFDFTLHTPNGFWKQFIDWIYQLIANGTITEQDFRLNELDILTLDDTAKITVDGINYLLKTISVMAGENLKVSRAKMLQLS